MTIVNIRDARSNHLDVRCDAVFEPAHHEDTRFGESRFPETVVKSLDDLCRLMTNTTIGEAIFEGQNSSLSLTLFIYDPNSQRDLAKALNNDPAAR